ncbi:putative reverse transcriptase domain-containing protein [Tanacetum coccineum]
MAILPQTYKSSSRQLQRQAPDNMNGWVEEEDQRGRREEEAEAEAEVWTGSSSSAAAAGHNPEDLTPSTLGVTWMHFIAGFSILRRRMVNAALEDRAGERSNARGQGNNEAGGQGGAPAARECTFSGFMKCNPTVFHGHEGAVELSRSIRENEIVATMGLEAANQMGWTEMRRLMTEEFCPIEEIQRMEHELWNLKVKEFDITAYTKRFHELVQLCPEMVPSERKKIEAYIRGLTDNIKEGSSSNRRIAEGNKRKWESSQGGNNGGLCGNTGSVIIVKSFTLGIASMTTVTCYDCGEKGHTRNYCPKKRDPRGEEPRGRAYVITDTEKQQGPNVVTGTFLLNNRYATVLFDSGSDSIVSVKHSFSHLIDINPVRLDTSYEVELADGRVASTNTILRGCTLNLLDHLFKIDLMPIELGTFDVVIGMDWLVDQDAVIVCGKKVVHIPVKNKTLIVEGDRSTSRLKIISCIKASKYIERGHQLFVAHVTEKEQMRETFGKRFIEDFSLISKPLTKLIEKNKKYEWGMEEDEAFQLKAEHNGYGDVLNAEGKVDSICFSKRKKT